MAADSLKRIGDKICQDYLGFNPTSNSTKPPHIANGLFRACIGETCDTRDVHEWVISVAAHARWQTARVPCQI